MSQILLALSLLLKLFTLYFAAVAVFTVVRRRAFPRRAPATRFAVLAAARNEEAVIGQLVESLKRQNYPSSLVDIYVIPNNCTDYTEAVAAASGAEIIRCLGRVRSKGDALREAFCQLLPKDYDAFVVFDADNVVDPDFLSRMNDAFLAGARVCKGKIRAANPGDSWVAGCYGLYFAVFDWFYSRPRSRCGLSAKLVGTGFAVHREVLEELGGWNTSTIAEDAEFSAQCARIGRRVFWVPEAVTYDEEPVDLRTSLHQRRRWCSGVMQVGRQELRRLAAGTGPLHLRLDMAMFLLNPFVQSVSILLLAVNLLLAGWTGVVIYLGNMLIGWLGLMLLGAVMAWREGYDMRTMIPAILGYPLFTATWMPLQVSALFRDTTAWREIRHQGRRRPATER